MCIRDSLVDRERELDVDGLLARQLREQGVLGGAGPAALVEDQPETGPLGDAAVGQPQHVARGRSVARPASQGDPGRAGPRLACTTRSTAWPTGRSMTPDR